MMEFDDIIQKRKDGNARFVSDNLENKGQDSKQRELLISGQSPRAIILGCSDSRVVPELIFDTGLGELFTVRVAGNIADSASIASIEFAVAQLNVGIIIVLGHDDCGAVTAAIAGGDAGYHLNLLMDHILPAIEIHEG